MNTKTKFRFLVLTILFPAVALAAPFTGLKELLSGFRGVLNALVPVLFALALIYFLWGVAQFILNDARNDKTREEGKKKIMWGVIALFIIFSIFGILNFISSATGIEIKGGSGAAGGGNGADYTSEDCTINPNQDGCL